MTNEPTGQPEHALIDFVSLAKVPTNEQRIVNALEQIVVLLTPATPPLSMSQFVAKEDLAAAKNAERAKQLDALAAKTMGKRK